MSNEQPKNPLHGVTLKAILTDLVARRGWEELGDYIDIRCFIVNPSLKSSLKFLRRTDWARAKVEALYLEDQRVIARNRKRNERRAARRAYGEELEAAKLVDGEETADTAGTAEADGIEETDATPGDSTYK